MLFHGLGEIVGFVVHGNRAVLLYHAHFFGVAHGGEGADAERAGDSERGDADAAGAAVHQQGFACAHLAVYKHVCPHGKQGFGQHGGFGKTVTVGQRQGLGGFDGAILGIRAAVGERANGVAEGKTAHAFAERGDGARQFQPHNRRYAVGHG